MPAPENPNTGAVTDRPALGTPAVGDPVYVREGGGRRIAIIPATITAVGRVWLTIRAVNSGREWRLRKDTQKDGHGVGYGTNFATPDQLAYDQKTEEAHKFLREQGIDVRYDSPWRGSKGVIALAEILRQVVAGGGC